MNKEEQSTSLKTSVSSSSHPRGTLELKPISAICIVGGGDIRRRDRCLDHLLRLLFWAHQCQNSWCAWLPVFVCRTIHVELDSLFAWHQVNLIYIPLRNHYTGSQGLRNQYTRDRVLFMFLVDWTSKAAPVFATLSACSSLFADFRDLHNTESCFRRVTWQPDSLRPQKRLSNRPYRSLVRFWITKKRGLNKGSG